MRQRVNLDVSVPQRISLPWDADSITVSNLTRYTLLVRVGADQAPTGTADADHLVPPLGQQVIPVAGRLFGFLLAPTPALSNAPPGMPNSCIARISAGERTPAFASANLASIYIASEQADLRNQAARAIGSWLDTGIVVPSNMRSLTLRNVGAGVSQIQVIGEQSGILYCYANFRSSGDLDGYRLSQPFNAALDSSVKVSLDSDGAANNYRLTASASPAEPSLVTRDARQVVTAFPPGMAFVPAGLVPFVPVTLLSTAARAGATLAGIIQNPGGYRGIRLWLHLTALGGGAGIGFRVGTRDSVTTWSAEGITFPVAGDSANAIGDWSWEAGVGYPDRNRTQNMMKSVNMGAPNQIYVFASPLDAATYTYGVSYEWLP